MDLSCTSQDRCSYQNKRRLLMFLRVAGRAATSEPLWDRLFHLNSTVFLRLKIHHHLLHRKNAKGVPAFSKTLQLPINNLRSV
jgi:hypothetical protein